MVVFEVVLLVALVVLLAWSFVGLVAVVLMVVVGLDVVLVVRAVLLLVVLVDLPVGELFSLAAVVLLAVALVGLTVLLLVLLIVSLLLGLLKDVPRVLVPQVCVLLLRSFYSSCITMRVGLVYTFVCSCRVCWSVGGVFACV